MTADMLCDYVWRNIFHYVANSDRGLVALVCHRFRRLSPWVDPIRALHHILIHPTPNERLAREILEFNQDILHSAIISKTVKSAEIFGLLCGAASMNLTSLFDALTLHNDFSAVLLHFFLNLKWTNCSYKVLSRKICTSPALVKTYLERWGENRFAMHALCNSAGEMYCEATINVILEYAIKQGALSNPSVPPNKSKIYSRICTDILMGAFYQENQDFLVASLDRVDSIDAMMAETGFKIAVRRRNWPAFKIFLRRFPDTELAIMQHFDVIEFGLDIAEFGNCFIEQFIHYPGGVMLFFEKVFRYYMMNCGTTIAANPVIDAIDNDFADAIGSILEKIYKADPQHQSAYLLSSAFLMSLLLLKNNSNANPAIFGLLHSVFHAAEPFLHHRHDWYDYFAFFSNSAGTDIASICIQDWIRDKCNSSIALIDENAEKSNKRKRERMIED